MKYRNYSFINILIHNSYSYWENALPLVKQLSFVSPEPLSALLLTQESDAWPNALYISRLFNGKSNGSEHRANIEESLCLKNYGMMPVHWSYWVAY